MKGVCGKPEETANLQNLLIFVLKGISVYGEKLKKLGTADRSNDDFVVQGLFATILHMAPKVLYSLLEKDLCKSGML